MKQPIQIHGTISYDNNLCGEDCEFKMIGTAVYATAQSDVGICCAFEEVLSYGGRLSDGKYNRCKQCVEFCDSTKE